MGFIHQLITGGPHLVSLHLFCLGYFPRCDLWCWYIKTYKTGWFDYGFYVGFYIPAPWSIWVERLTHGLIFASRIGGLLWIYNGFFNVDRMDTWGFPEIGGTLSFHQFLDGFSLWTIHFGVPPSIETPTYIPYIILNHLKSHQTSIYGWFWGSPKWIPLYSYWFVYDDPKYIKGSIILYNHQPTISY